MSRESLLMLLADSILVVHVSFIGFIVFGLLAIYLGHFFRWSWVRNRTFRIFHFSAICFVVVQSWFGAICPLTIWEMALREDAGSSVYSGSFIQYWLHRMIYFDAPEWVFIVLYTGFGCLVLVSWFLVRPSKDTG